ncbi:MAG TPA: hypothetical protein VJ946_03080 [Bacteroidales bacterium]|nr:hypothetical protein [Bacteroidales bacterium]
MKQGHDDIRTTFLKRQTKLEQARVTLKLEFIGISEIIDEIIDNVSSWYFLPHIQEKPVVINLWGLTGVGKTSLVNRLTELIHFEDRYYRFDLGEKEGSLSFRDCLDDLFENKDSSPVIIALDEIQHSRTVSGPLRQEVDSDKNRMIWELIDSGKIQYVDWKPGLWSLEDDIVKLNHLLKRGIKVSNGLVKSHIDLYINEMQINYEEGDELPFVPQYAFGRILDYAGEELGFHLQTDVEKFIKSMSAEEAIHFLKKVIKIAKRPTVKNFSKALIFVMGNLDEAYSMSNNFSADIDADEFNKLSRKISIPDIKKALQSRFRNEQIARLGNVHIIYPSLSKASYKKIIDNEFKTYAKKLSSEFHLDISFDISVNKLIYSEGVYPTQGVRPVYTSIHHIIKSKISTFFTEIFTRRKETDRLHFSIENNKLTCEFYSDNILIHSMKRLINTPLGSMRKNTRNDSQAITAVHESGHTVLSAVLLKTVPDVVYSITSDADNQGFMVSGFVPEYISRKDIIPHVALMLGGYVAEELIFGKAHLTAGASGDIEKATTFLSRMYKEHGMGITPIKYSTPQDEDPGVYHQNSLIEEKIKQRLEKAKSLAEINLREERRLLLALADNLSDNRMMKKKQIQEYVSQFASKPEQLSDSTDIMFYRSQLKQQVKECEITSPTSRQFDNVFSLNRVKRNVQD